MNLIERLRFRATQTMYDVDEQPMNEAASALEEANRLLHRWTHYEAGMAIEGTSLYDIALETRAYLAAQGDK